MCEDIIKCGLADAAEFTKQRDGDASVFVSQKPFDFFLQLIFGQIWEV